MEAVENGYLGDFEDKRKSTFRESIIIHSVATTQVST